MYIVQVPRGVRAGGPLHLAGHPQHPAVLRHAARRAEAAEAHHQQEQQQREEERGKQRQEGRRGQVNIAI